jgi:hypothetical protein
MYIFPPDRSFMIFMETLFGKLIGQMSMYSTVNQKCTHENISGYNIVSFPCNIKGKFYHNPVRVVLPI